jgi:biopolymer transport protein TolQ
LTANHSLLDFFINAGPVVKIVMLILLLASLISWTFIFQRWAFLAGVKSKLKKFEKQFWSGVDLKQFYATVKEDKNNIGIGSMFTAGFAEFMRLHQRVGICSDELLQGVRRAMLAEESRITEKLEAHLPFLATVGSTSPYIGLFGTVWGIMTAFSALGAVQQASIAMVAPGISEALIATAMGLFAAIPAVIGYNRFTTRADQILNRLDSFQEDFIRVLYHQIHKTEEA